MSRIGILTWHYYSNFGSALQAYALQHTIDSLGHDVHIINYRNKALTDPKWKYYVKYIFSKICDYLHVKIPYPFVLFSQDFFRQTKWLGSKEECGKIAEKFDVLVCGSDQIWAPNVCNPIYMLDFAVGHTKKISYAASIGLDDIPNNLISRYSKLLSDFYRVSVREKAGGLLLKNKCGIETQVVLDPTFLVSIHIWKKLEKEVEGIYNYIFCYFLKKNHEYRNIIMQYAKENGCGIVGVSSNSEDVQWMDLKLTSIGPQEFLWLIHHAKIVFTDSYHGTIFSLLYHKKFVLYERFKETDKICQNSRIYQLVDWFGIDKQILKTSDENSHIINHMNYDEFEERLGALREMSMNFLAEALR